MAHRFALLMMLLPALLLTACGDTKSVGGSSASATARGTLLQDPPQLVSSLPAASLLLELQTASNEQLFALGGTPVCDISVYHIEYNTVGGANEATTASGALMVPGGTNAKCTGARPIVLYAHATQTDRTFDIADLNNAENAEGLILATFFASQGYIVVAPNYAGYDTSTLNYHPFLNADQQSKDMIDALTAARSALPAPAAPFTHDGGQLFIMGYSQGGHVAMATHRAMQAAGMSVTASAPMSGPYAMGAFVDAIFEGEVNTSAPVLTTLLFDSYQDSYANVYAAPTDVYSTQYASDIGSLLPSTTPRSQLYSEGLLPEYALFSATPPAPAYAAMTPAITPADLAPVFALGFGANNLLTNAFRLSYLQDAQANPDGGFPAVTTGVAAAAPGLALRQDLKLNDLRTWTPAAPMLLCGGDGDPTVFWLNTQLMQGYWTTNAPKAPITIVDLDAAVTGGDPYAGLKTGFAAAKGVVALAAVAQGATDGGLSAVNGVYHTTLLPPFCVAAVKSFFDAQ